MVGTATLIETPILHDMTCVCCNCRREKVSPDEWREYTPQSGERVSHGICPECLYELYPDVAPLIRPRG